MLTKEAILAIDDLPRREVFIPAWNRAVYVRPFTAGERVRLSKLISDGAATPAQVAVMALVNESGDRLFADDEADALAAKNGAAVQTIVDEAMRYNFMADPDDAGNA